MNFLSLESEQYKRLVESFKDFSQCALVIFDDKGSIKDLSNGAKTLLALDKSESNNQINLVDLLEGYASIDEILSLVLNDKEYSGTMQIKSTSFILEVNCFIKQMHILDQTLYSIIFSPITDTEDLKQHNEKMFSCVKTISTILNSTLDLDETLNLILDKLNDIINYDLSCVMFLDGYNLSIKASKTVDNQYVVPKKISLNDNKELSELLKSKSIIISGDEINNNPLITALDIDWASEVILMPLLLQDSFFGLMVIVNREKQTYSLEDLKIIELFASTSAYSIKNSELSNVFRMQLRILRENVIERTKALELIKIQNQKILEADRMKNEFIAHMSHELRTPLHAIIGFSEALKMEIFGKLNEKQDEYIDDIHTSGIHLLGMINDMLDLSKIEAKKMDMSLKEFSIELATNEVINVVLALANRKFITVEEKFNHTVDEIYADHRKYQQILYNLLSNAIKFTHNKGLIHIITEDSELDHQPALMLTIKDSGIGISQENIDKIFQKFQQIDNELTNSQAGSGLGLTITKELVEMHKGRIYVESKEKEGSSFIIVLPLQTKI